MARKNKYDFTSMRQRAADNTASVRAQYGEIDPASGLATIRKREPVELVKQIGGCKVVRINLSSRQSYYIAAFNGKQAEGSTPRAAVYALNSNRIRRIKGEIPALRVWKLVGEFLAPVATGHPDFSVAGPVLVADALPTKYNTSGYWAIKLNAQHRLRNLAASYHAHAYGHVGMFGRVVEHELGYRAEKMIIRKVILLIPASPEFCEALGNRYDCEVVSNPASHAY